MWKRPQTCPCFREINASSRRATHTDHADGADDADDEFEEKYRSGIKGQRWLGTVAFKWPNLNFWVA